MLVFADIIINKKSPALDRIFTYAVPDYFQSDIQVGILVQVPFNRQLLEGVVIAIHENAPEMFAAKDIDQIISEKPIFSQELLNLATWMANYYHCSRASALQAMLPAGMNLVGKKPKAAYRDYYSLAAAYQDIRQSSKRKSLIDILLTDCECDIDTLKKSGFDRTFLNAAEKAGLVSKVSRRILAEDEQYQTNPAGFNDEQQWVYDDIIKEHNAKNRPYLLHGITGSGKTEIYLRLIRDAAARGEQSILLVPEIALSAQMVEMLAKRLEVPMALLHSGLLGTQRRQIWQDIAAGRISVIVGARSAVFAPAPNLGLIIIDEEQENSYKQDNNPRFHAITTAVKRSELCGAQLILGSATPSIVSYNQAEEGNYALGELNEPYYSAKRPDVSIVDMREELRSGHKLIFSRELILAIEDTLAKNKQAILFLNRRGYYSFFACRDCGQSISCDHCAVSLSFHDDKYGGKLKCHYCGQETKPPELCPNCGSQHIRRFGIGTQRVADEAAKMFPQARIGRLDSDVMEERGGHIKVYEAMQKREIDILVGTQMVAKGLDFPHLDLAAVIAADTMLNMPDWRAGERTYQLISQLIGRAGRREQQGRAIIQTYNPEAPPILAAAAHDYQAFYRYELLQRQMHGYPPYSHLLKILLTSQDKEDLVRTTAAYSHYLSLQLSDEDEICGPADAPYARIKDRWRRQIIIKSENITKVVDLASIAFDICKAEERLPQDLLIAMDIDPMSLF